MTLIDWLKKVKETLEFGSDVDDLISRLPASQDIDNYYYDVGKNAWIRKDTIEDNRVQVVQSEFKKDYYSFDFELDINKSKQFQIEANPEIPEGASTPPIPYFADQQIDNPILLNTVSIFAKNVENLGSSVEFSVWIYAKGKKIDGVYSAVKVFNDDYADTKDITTEIHFHALSDFIVIVENTGETTDFSMNVFFSKNKEHNELEGLNAGTSYEHITQTQKDGLHTSHSIPHNETTGQTSDDHHQQVHDHIHEHNHAELENILTDDHHTRYTDANVITAVQNAIAVILAGEWIVNTNTNSNLFWISRNTAKNQALSFGVDDTYAYIKYYQDETSTQAHNILFDIISGASGNHGYNFKVNGTSKLFIGDDNIVPTKPLSFGALTTPIITDNVAQYSTFGRCQIGINGSGYAYFGYRGIGGTTFGFRQNSSFDTFLNAGSGRVLYFFNNGGQVGRVDGTKWQFNKYIDMNSNKITELATPTSDYDACTKKYSDDNSGVPSKYKFETTGTLGFAKNAYYGHNLTALLWDVDARVYGSVYVKDGGTFRMKCALSVSNLVTSNMVQTKVYADTRGNAESASWNLESNDQRDWLTGLYSSNARYIKTFPVDWVITSGDHVGILIGKRNNSGGSSVAVIRICSVWLERQ